MMGDQQIRREKLSIPDQITGPRVDYPDGQFSIIRSCRDFRQGEVFSIALTQVLGRTFGVSSNCCVTKQRHCMLHEAYLYIQPCEKLVYQIEIFDFFNIFQHIQVHAVFV